MVGRRAELTHQGNRDAGRHGWLRLTPAYSIQIVDQLLESLDGERVLDPFCGTGTTPLCATERGRRAVALDVNPFLVWFAGTKLKRFRAGTIEEARRVALQALDQIDNVEPYPAPPIHNVHRWWSEEVLDWLCRLRAGLRQRTSATSLAQIAFCRTMIAVSGAAFDHVSMSFRDPTQASTETLRRRFVQDLDAVLAGAAHMPKAKGEIRRGDARSLEALRDDKFDVVVTSPPYPNRMSYVRELRPYMYWTGHLEIAREAGELDWKAIGGTWGIATSRLKDYERTSGKRPRGLGAVMKRISRAHDKNGPLLARYLDRYFEDIEAHLSALRPHVRRGGSVHYVIGNASFYGELVEAERYYVELLRRAGFKRPSVEILRKRNSKKELYEFVVSATA